MLHPLSSPLLSFIAPSDGNHIGDGALPLFASGISRLQWLVGVFSPFGMSADCVFVDPHMHLWDFQEHPDTHDRSLLAGVRERALPLHYEREIEVRLIMAQHSR